MSRRWWKTPEAMLQEFRRLLIETDYPASKCARLVGIKSDGSGGPVRAVITSCRRYIGNGRWVDRTTGKLRPAHLCADVCAADKVGVSVRTVRRRIKEGVVSPNKAASNTAMRSFTEGDIKTLRAVGRKKPGTSVLSHDDVLAIRELAAKGIAHSAIAKIYPVLRRQISRIVSGERWAA